MTTTYLMDERLGFLALNRVSWIQLPVRGFHPGGPGSTPDQGACPFLHPATTFARSARACEDAGNDDDDGRATDIHAMGVGGWKRPPTRPNRDSNPGPSD